MTEAPILLTLVVSGDRRELERRRHTGVPEPLQRRSERRDEQRRSSPRVPQRLWVSDPREGGVPQVYEGEISLWGASWWARYPPMSGELEVRFRIPHHPYELTARARVVREDTLGDDTKVQVEFTDVELEEQLALARYLELRNDTGRRAVVAPA